MNRQLVLLFLSIIKQLIARGDTVRALASIEELIDDLESTPHQLSLPLNGD